MNGWCLSFIAPVFLLTAGQLNSHQSQIRHLSPKILTLLYSPGSIDQQRNDLLPDGTPRRAGEAELNPRESASRIRVGFRSPGSTASPPPGPS